MNNLRLLAILCCLFCSFNCSVQHKRSKKTSSTIISKKVQDNTLTATRERFIIDICDTTNPNTKKVLQHTFDFAFNPGNELIYFENHITHKFDTLYSDLPFKDSAAASFPEYILDIILRRKVNAYLAYLPDEELIQPLPIKRVFEAHFPPPDVFHMEDPSRELIVRKANEHLHFNQIVQLQVITNKMYDFKTKKSSWKIVTITPLKAIYDNNGALQGKAGLYKIKYADLKPIIAAYEKLHKECIISKGIQNILDGKGVKIED